MLVSPEPYEYSPRHWRYAQQIGAAIPLLAFLREEKSADTSQFWLLLARDIPFASTQRHVSQQMLGQ